MLLDFGVEVDEPPAKAVGEDRPDRTLAGTRQADEDDAGNQPASGPESDSALRSASRRRPSWSR
jgi:hypothetical protein